jgi:hypothetical protein
MQNDRSKETNIDVSGDLEDVLVLPIKRLALISPRSASYLPGLFLLVQSIPGLILPVFVDR